MKKFFKKIGRGLKRLGGHISKFMNSKIGRVIGTVALAYSMYGIFQAIAKGATQATAQGIAQAGAETAVTEGTKVVATETAKAATTEVATAAVKNVDSYAGLVSDLSSSVPVNNEIIASEMSQNIISPETFKDISSSTIKNLEVSQVSDKAFYDKLYTEGQVMLDAKPSDFPSYTENLDDFNFSMPNETVDQTLKQRFDSQYIKKLDLDPLNITPEHQNAMNVYSELNTLTPTQKATWFRTPGNVDQYTQAQQFLGDDIFKVGLEKTPSQLGGLPYKNVIEAAKAGENPLQSGLNVAEQIFSHDIASLSRGTYTGPLSNTKAYTAASTTASLLTPPEEIEMPSQPNYLAAQQSAALQQSAVDIASTPSVTPLMAIPDEMLSSSNPVSTFNQIRSNAGFGQLYGPLYQFS
jgi:hypothetical protein